jgi:hypothetical protein
MTCIGKSAHLGDWCGAPLLVWVELAPPRLWLDTTAVVEALLARCSTWTFGMLLEVGCSEPSAMLERFWVGGRFWVEVWGRASSGWRCWLIHLGGMVRVIFKLGTRWAPNVEI